MSLLVQFKCLFYSFICGFSILSVYHFINRLIYHWPIFIKLFIDFIMGFIYAYVFYKGIVYFNYGILSIYEFIFLFVGYYVYQKYYAYYELIILERLIRIIIKIISPLVFFFKKINAIMFKRVRSVMKRWQKGKNSS